MYGLVKNISVVIACMTLCMMETVRCTVYNIIILFT